ncbi:MAG: DUF5652 family protein [Dysgonamonadaceae bacterium]|jgi:predicted neutral ceramidase superfamily lipid hydrolase|nr:DUF5652 family protein [Dysgonamonadaceae bacterium]MDD3309342.1 DUF5652 family protein [Dysgonamonadaceae bacterium]MDD3900538.1 DUF5652 family protein [Dysgonamonadaceae bacterium]MDD4399055.1 DUF5652 family protein [Dysgonamonadaceae bacterium]MEA5081113.1 DUF5652 family protein [Dysgonamonadaceae bacterium]
MNITFIQDPLIKTIIIIALVFDVIMKLIAMWKSARNNHLIWFICLVIFNTVGILPIVYLIMYRDKKQIKDN